MSRRKLLLEQMLDGETRLSSDPSFHRVLNSAIESERLVFSQAVIHDAIDALSGKDTADFIDLCVPPFKSMWVETEHHNRAWIVQRGSYAALADTLGLPPNGFPAGTDPRFVDDMVAVYSILQTSGSTDEFQVMPAATLISLVGNKATGGATRFVLSMSEGPLALTPDEVKLVRELAYVPLMGFFALNTIGASRTEIVEADEGLRKNREKRNKPPLKNYTYVHTLMRDEGEAVTGEYGGTKTAHLVRGHFKRRKTGTFWWKPHIAGSGELKKRDAYIVKP